MTKLKVRIPCDEANHVCDKTQYNDASLWEKIKLNIHLLYCKACRGYTKNNTRLTKVMKQSKVECLDIKHKDSMKKELEKAIRDQAS